jgi:uncharacterized protein involved in exopolysaccharide biosynthesis
VSAATIGAVTAAIGAVSAVLLALFKLPNERFSLVLQGSNALVITQADVIADLRKDLDAAREEIRQLRDQAALDKRQLRDDLLAVTRERDELRARVATLEAQVERLKALNGDA